MQQGKKGKGMAVMIAIGKPKSGPGGPPPEMDEPGPPSRRSSVNNSQETPEEETRFHQEGGRPAPTPESVDYHTAEEACGNCEYFQEGQCAFLQMPVSEGDWCKRFESVGEDRQEEAAEQEPMGYDNEGAEGGGGEAA